MYWHDEQVLLRLTHWQKAAAEAAEAHREQRAARRRGTLRRMARVINQVRSVVL